MKFIVETASVIYGFAGKWRDREICQMPQLYLDKLNNIWESYCSIFKYAPLGLTLRISIWREVYSPHTICKLSWGTFKAATIVSISIHDLKQKQQQRIFCFFILQNLTEETMLKSGCKTGSSPKEKQNMWEMISLSNTSCIFFSTKLSLRVLEQRQREKWSGLIAFPRLFYMLSQVTVWLTVAAKTRRWVCQC